MTLRATRDQRGFSLLEVLIGISLLLVALATIAMALGSNQRSYVRGQVKIGLQQNARLALAAMATEIRMSGYFPENFASPPASPELDNAIQIATHDALALHGDLDGSGGSNVFLYCLDGNLLRRGRAADGDTSAYWCPAGEVLAENVTSLRFDYFDENGLPVPSSPSAPFKLDGQQPGSVPDLTVTTERAAVRRIVVSLAVTEDIIGQGSQAFTLGSDVRLRNVR